MGGSPQRATQAADRNPLEGMECANEQLFPRYDLNQPEAAPARCTICSEHSTRTSRSTVSKPAERSRSTNTEHAPKPAGRERSRQTSKRAVSGPSLPLEPDWNLSMASYTQRCDCRCNATALLEERKEWQNGRQTAADKSSNKRDSCRETEDETSNFSAPTKQSSSKEALAEDTVSQASLVRLQAKGHSTRS